MKSDYVAAFIQDGEVFCDDCLGDIEPNEGLSPIFACSEWSEYPVCVICGEVHDYVTKIEE